MKHNALLALALFLTPATVVGAQLAPERPAGSNILAKPTAMDPEVLGRVRKYFAQCLHRTEGPKTRALLDSSDNASVDLKAAGLANLAAQLPFEYCLGQSWDDNNKVQLKFAPIVLRDLLAEEAYLSSNSKAPTLASPPPPLAEKLVSVGDQMERARTLSAFSDCAIVADVTKADAMLRTMPGSRAERTAVQALAPTLGSCLFEGQQISLTTANVRAVLAYAMWNRFVRNAGSK